MRTLLILFGLLSLLAVSACGLDGPPPAGQDDHSPATGGFIPAE